MNNLPTPRPYNSYNLFFQIEREYILQTLLGYQPTIASKDVFNPNDETYPADGPFLPSRYENLILPYDWHIPGKGLRRKRTHRKSHGKIGFHGLSERISKSWSVADDDIRNFCARLAEIQTRKYKETKREAMEKGAGKQRIEMKMIVTKTIEKSDPKDDACKDNFPSFDWTANLPANFSNFYQGDSAVSFKSGDTEHDCISLTTAGHRSPLAEVDMEDNEIIDLWTNSQNEGDAARSAISLSRIGNHTATTGARENEKERQYDTRNSFIDAQYEQFNEIGKQLLTRKKLPSKLKRRGFAACQA